ncbi:MAG: hypothetical protein GYA85_01500 [Propionibacterium sp.]|nr:hypothetical protein [Propionibacterium sp.]
MSADAPSAPKKKGAGLFDIRNFIGLLLLAYGVILTAMGLFADPAFDKTGGVNANLFTGIGLLVAGAVFVGWARLKPVIVDEAAASDTPRPPSH